MRRGHTIHVDAGSILRPKPPSTELLNGASNAQVIGVRGALMNYHRLMERHRRTVSESKPDLAAQKGGG